MPARKYKRRTYHTNRSQYIITVLLAEMSDGPKSARELAATLHIDHSAVSAYLSHIGARIARWRTHERGGLPTPMYDMSSGPNAPRPRVKSAKEKKAELWKRIKADPIRHAREKEKHRRQRRARKGITGVTVHILPG